MTNDDKVTIELTAMECPANLLKDLATVCRAALQADDGSYNAEVANVMYFFVGRGLESLAKLKDPKVVELERRNGILLREAAQLAEEVIELTAKLDKKKGKKK